MAREIDHTLKIHKLERKCIQNGDTYINFFKNADHEDPFHVQWQRMKSSVETSEGDNACVKCQGSYNEGEEWLYCPVCR